MHVQVCIICLLHPFNLQLQLRFTISIESDGQRTHMRLYMCVNKVYIYMHIDVRLFELLIFNYSRLGALFFESVRCEAQIRGLLQENF